MVDQVQNVATNTHIPDVFSNFIGTTHQATVLACTKGALVVSLTLKGIIFKGVLLDATQSTFLCLDDNTGIVICQSLAGLRAFVCKLSSKLTGRTITRPTKNSHKIISITINNSIIPTILTLPPKVEFDQQKELEKRTCYLQASDCENIGSSTQYRATYQPGESEANIQKVIQSRSIHKIHEQKRLRSRINKPKYFLCSLCRTHCLDTDNSDKESTEASYQQQTPAIKISYKSPDGQNIMEIVPKKAKKSFHKRKHHSKPKKHAKKSKYDIDDVGNRSRQSNNPNPAEEINEADGVNVFDQLMIDISETNSTNKTMKSATSETSEFEKTSKQANVKKQLKKKPHTVRSSHVKDSDMSILSERKSRSVSLYESADGKQISVGDVIWGKVTGFPWWPGRVCAITVNETKDGIIIDHIADIDWYCSPTKSHLPCSQLYPFLEHFEKRLDKKKKTSSYKNAVAEAKCDAVLNAQYLESIVDDVNCGDGGTIPSTTNTIEVPRKESYPEDDNVNPLPDPHILSLGHEPSLSERLINEKDVGGQSPSMLIDAFLRSEDNSNELPSKLKSEMAASNILSAANDDDNDLSDCLTISLPSPQTLLSNSSGPVNFNN